MKKRWFVVILTIGLLLHVLPLSVLALSPDPTITDSDGTILDWSDLSTVPYSLDDLQEQEPPVPDLLETGSEKSLASNEATVDDRSAGNLTPKLLTRNRVARNRMTRNRMTRNRMTRNRVTRNRMTRNRMTRNRMTRNRMTRNRMTMALRTTTAAPQPRLCARSTRSTIRTTTPHWTMQSLPRRMVIRSTC